MDQGRKEGVSVPLDSSLLNVHPDRSLLFDINVIEKKVEAFPEIPPVLAKSHPYFVYGTLADGGKRDIVAMIDTGAAVSIIKANALDNVPAGSYQFIPIDKVKHMLVNADGRKYEYDNLIQIKITVEDDFENMS